MHRSSFIATGLTNTTSANYLTALNDYICVMGVVRSLFREKGIALV